MAAQLQRLQTLSENDSWQLLWLLPQAYRERRGDPNTRSILRNILLYCCTEYVAHIFLAALWQYWTRSVGWCNREINRMWDVRNMLNCARHCMLQCDRVIVRGYGNTNTAVSFKRLACLPVVLYFDFSRNAREKGLVKRQKNHQRRKEWRRNP